MVLIFSEIWITQTTGVKTELSVYCIHKSNLIFKLKLNILNTNPPSLAQGNFIPGLISMDIFLKKLSNAFNIYFI